MCHLLVILSNIGAFGVGGLGHVLLMFCVPPLSSADRRGSRLSRLGPRARRAVRRVTAPGTAARPPRERALRAACHAPTIEAARAQIGKTDDRKY